MNSHKSEALAPELAPAAAIHTPATASAAVIRGSHGRPTIPLATSGGTKNASSEGRAPSSSSRDWVQARWSVSSRDACSRCARSASLRVARAWEV